MRAILPVVLTVVLIVVTLAVVIGISLSIGWVLTLFLPFSLFEATVLGMLAAGVTWVVWHKILRSVSTFELMEEESDYESDEIPQARFWKTRVGKTWENWFRYVIANSIYEDFLDSPRWLAVMNEGQLQEMSIRLADTALGALKAKSPRTKRLRVSKGMLKQELIKLGQQPYDDDILDTAVAAVNVELVYLDEELREVMREQLWDEPAEVF